MISEERLIQELMIEILGHDRVNVVVPELAPGDHYTVWRTTTTDLGTEYTREPVIEVTSIVVPQSNRTTPWRKAELNSLSFEKSVYFFDQGGLEYTDEELGGRALVSAPQVQRPTRRYGYGDEGSWAAYTCQISIPYVVGTLDSEESAPDSGASSSVPLANNTPTDEES